MTGCGSGSSILTVVGIGVAILLARKTYLSLEHVEPVVGSAFSISLRQVRQRLPRNLRPHGTYRSHICLDAGTIAVLAAAGLLFALLRLWLYDPVTSLW